MRAVVTLLRTALVVPVIALGPVTTQVSVSAAQAPTTNTNTNLVAEVTEDVAIDDVDTLGAGDRLTSKYQVIADRNPFNLQPPAPPPPPKQEEAPKESVSLKELDLTIAGVSSRGGDKRVWLSMTLPPTQPEAKPVTRFFPFRENEQQHGVTVKSIKMNGDIDIEYDGTPVLLTLDTHSHKNKKKAKPKTNSRANPKSNVRTARTSSAPKNSAVTARTGNSSRNRTQPTNRSTPRSATNSAFNRSATTAPRTIPPRNIRTAPQPALSRDEQIAVAEAQQALAEQEGRFLPPIPPIRR